MCNLLPDAVDRKKCHEKCMSLRQEAVIVSAKVFLKQREKFFR